MNGGQRLEEGRGSQELDAELHSLHVVNVNLLSWVLHKCADNERAIDTHLIKLFYLEVLLGLHYQLSQSDGDATCQEIVISIFECLPEGQIVLLILVLCLAWVIKNYSFSSIGPIRQNDSLGNNFRTLVTLGSHLLFLFFLGLVKNGQ